MRKNEYADKPRNHKASIIVLILIIVELPMAWVSALVPVAADSSLKTGINTIFWTSVILFIMHLMIYSILRMFIKDRLKLKGYIILPMIIYLIFLELWRSLTPILGSIFLLY